MGKVKENLEVGSSFSRLYISFNGSRWAQSEYFPILQVLEEMHAVVNYSTNFFSQETGAAKNTKKGWVNVILASAKRKSHATSRNALQMQKKNEFDYL